MSGEAAGYKGRHAAGKAAPVGASMSGWTANLVSLTSVGDAAPANAAALAAAHKVYPATLQAAPAGPVANVNLVLTDLTVQIAPSIKYSAWAWAGGAPGSSPTRSPPSTRDRSAC